MELTATRISNGGEGRPPSLAEPPPPSPVARGRAEKLLTVREGLPLVEAAHELLAVVGSALDSSGVRAVRRTRLEKRKEADCIASPATLSLQFPLWAWRHVSPPALKWDPQVPTPTALSEVTRSWLGRGPGQFRKDFRVLGEGSARNRDQTLSRLCPQRWEFGIADLLCKQGKPVVVREINCPKEQGSSVKDGSAVHSKGLVTFHPSCNTKTPAKRSLEEQLPRACTKVYTKKNVHFSPSVLIYSSPSKGISPPTPKLADSPPRVEPWRSWKETPPTLMLLVLRATLSTKSQVDFTSILDLRQGGPEFLLLSEAIVK